MSDKVSLESLSPKERRSPVMSHRDICELNKQIPPQALIGLEDDTVPFVIARKAYMGLRHHLEPYYTDQRQLNRMAYRCYLLFGSPDKVHRYLRSCNKTSYYKHLVTDSLERISMPPPHCWHRVDFRSWGEAFATDGYLKVNPVFKAYAAMTPPLRNKRGNISLNLTAFTIAAADIRTDENGHDVDMLIQLARQFNKSDNEFQRIIEYYSTAIREKIQVPPHIELPDLNIKGEEFGLSGAVFSKLRRDDPRISFLGDFTNCCERVGDKKTNALHSESHELEGTVAHAMRSVTNAYYAVEKNGEILTHSWAWRGKNAEFVFDGFESRARNFNERNLKDLLCAVDVEMHKRRYQYLGLKGLYVGHCAKHLDIEKIYYGIKLDDIKPQSLKGYGMNTAFFRNVCPL